MTVLNNLIAPHQHSPWKRSGSKTHPRTSEVLKERRTAQPSHFEKYRLILQKWARKTVLCNHYSTMQRIVIRLLENSVTERIEDRRRHSLSRRSSSTLRATLLTECSKLVRNSVRNGPIRNTRRGQAARKWTKRSLKKDLTYNKSKKLSQANDLGNSWRRNHANRRPKSPYLVATRPPKTWISSGLIKTREAQSDRKNQAWSSSKRHICIRLTSTSKGCTRKKMVSISILKSTGTKESSKGKLNVIWVPKLTTGNPTNWVRRSMKMSLDLKLMQEGTLLTAAWSRIGSTIKNA